MKFRSAISGRWVTRLFARSNPATTVSESSAKPVAISVRCSFCLKGIPWGSAVCPHCQSELDGGDAA